MKCCDFYAEVRNASSKGCKEFRYCNSSMGDELEVGFLDSRKIVSQSVLELKGAIAGWEVSQNYVKASVSEASGIRKVVLSESNEASDPRGVDYVFANTSNILILQGFAG